MTSYWQLGLILIVGATTSACAGVEHPSGPEELSMVHRTIQFEGKARNVLLSLDYPAPDEVVDWAPDNSFSVANPRKTALSLTFKYKGHFWQSHFGSVVFIASIFKRQEGLEPWKDMDALLKGALSRHMQYGDETTDLNVPPGTQTWMRPFISQLNGTSCIEQYVAYGNLGNAERLFYIPADEDHALQLKIWLVDNSDRPGLPPSDWLPRAQAFAGKLVSRVKIEIEERKHMSASTREQATIDPEPRQSE